MIKLGKNRDNAKLWITDDGFLQSDKPYVLKYMRVILDENFLQKDNPADGIIGMLDSSHIASIDPSGGPMLSVGDKLQGKEIIGFEDTENGMKINFKNL